MLPAAAAPVSRAALLQIAARLLARAVALCAVLAAPLGVAVRVSEALFAIALAALFAVRAPLQRNILRAGQQHKVVIVTLTMATERSVQPRILG